MREAQVGDVGIIEDGSATPGSGLATLHIKLSKGDDAGQIVLLNGDFRMIDVILSDLRGEEVRVVEGEDFLPSVRPTAWDDGTEDAEEPEDEPSITEISIFLTRPAVVGDKGVVRCAVARQDSNLATLEIALENNVRATISRERDVIQNLVSRFVCREVEVIDVERELTIIPAEPQPEEIEGWVMALRKVHGADIAVLEIQDGPSGEGIYIEGPVEQFEALYKKFHECVVEGYKTPEGVWDISLPEEDYWG